MLKFILQAFSQSTEHIYEKSKDLELEPEPYGISDWWIRIRESQKHAEPDTDPNTAFKPLAISQNFNRE